jgi:AsmA family
VFVTSDYVRAQVENHAKAISGHKTKIARLAIDWGWTPHVHLEQVELSNADWGKADHMFKVQQIEFDIRLWPLLHGDIVLPRLVLRNPELYLERNADDQSNWSPEESPVAHAAVKQVVPQQRRGRRSHPDPRRRQACRAPASCYRSPRAGRASQSDPADASRGARRQSRRDQPGLLRLLERYGAAALQDAILQAEYINVTSDNLNVTASSPNWFIHSGSGMDAIAVNSGTNVLDGGTGSNFLVGGTGTDTFFVDDRGASADIWSTVVGFHQGDAATIWGVTPQDFNLARVDGQGAAGYTGLTLHATVAIIANRVANTRRIYAGWPDQRPPHRAVRHRRGKRRRLHVYPRERLSWTLANFLEVSRLRRVPDRRRFP